MAFSGGFRPDIQGLRALAVLSVVLFHLHIAGFDGGYTGVDIFFVISGYLITRNILGDVHRGRFTFANFYARRVRRIFPAMLATVAATILAGALWFPPDKLVTTAQSAFASLAFVSNVYFWWNSHQYFSADSGFLSLLHLWSLSVEEQFYIFWPLIIVVISRARPARLALYVGLIGLASFASAYVFGRGDGSGVFYLMPFRVYQFSLGALALFVEQRLSAGVRTQRTVQVLGLVLCAIGIFALTAHLRFLGVASALGAALIICGGSQGASNPLLVNPVASYIGRISYSLYLVHWPVAVFANYVVGPQASGLAGLIIQFVLIFGLAALMHEFVEQPFLSPHNSPRQALHVKAILAASVVLAIVSLSVLADGGWGWRLNGAQQSVDEMEEFGSAPCARDKVSCTFGAPDGKVAAILIGDSYAQHYVAGLDRIARRVGVGVDEEIQQGCLILSGLMRLGYPDDRCRNGRDRVLAAVEKSTAPVIISEAWMGYMNGSIGDDSGRAIDVRSEQKRIEVLRQGLVRTIKAIERPGRRILIVGSQVLAACDFSSARLGVGPLPHEQSTPCRPRSRDDARHATSGVDRMLSEVQASFPGMVSLLRPVDYMCDATCPIVDDGTWLYQDAGHLTVAGSLRFGARANDALTDFLLGRRPVGEGTDRNAGVLKK